jgi:hypothetical protein
VSDTPSAPSDYDLSGALIGNSFDDASFGPSGGTMEGSLFEEGVAAGGIPIGVGSPMRGPAPPMPI